MSLNPFIFVGLGGTGGKTLGVIRETLSNTLDRVGWREEWPNGWQFVHIDVPADPDAKSEDIPYSLTRTQYVGLTNRKSTYSNYAAGITTSLRRSAPDESMRFQAWECWQPSPASSVKVNIVNGAGQWRAIGRVCALQQLESIDHALSAAFSAASSADSAPELARIQQLVDPGGHEPTVGRPVIFVVGSVAGGSGSGMALDVCDVLRSHGHNEVNAVLFTPEVFERPDGSIDPGVAPNTFMALNELTNAMWTTDPSDAPLSRNLLFSRAGVGFPTGHGGPSTVFLVGRRNGAITFSNRDDVYKIVGRSLAELALDEVLTRDVVAYDLANSQAIAAGGTDGLELSSPRSPVKDLAVFRSMGFSRLSVGRDFFERYSVDRLSRAVAIRLLDGHLLRKQPGSTLSDAELLGNAVDDAWYTFLEDSQLDEYGSEQNAITDRLRTLDTPEISKAQRTLRDKAHTAIARAAVKGKVKTIDAGNAVDREVELARPSVLQTNLRVIGEKAAEFQADIQNVLSRAIAQRVADEGLPVTAALLKRLISRSQEALKSLDQDVANYQQLEQETRRSLAVGRAVSAVEFPLSATDEVEGLLNQARKAMGRAIQVQYHEYAHRMLKDLIDNLLEPWHRAVLDADGLLRGEVRPTNQDSILDSWPTGDVPGEERNVPDSVRPSKVEFLMDDVDRFPDDFQSVIDRSVAGVSGGAAIDQAIRDVAAGRNLGRAAELSGSQPVVEYEMAWSPEWNLARLDGRTKAAARIKLHLHLGDIRRRAHDWIWDDEKAYGQYLRTNLNEYLTDPQVSQTERKNRRARLLGQFQAMVRASLPLVAVDPDMAQQIHGHDQPPFTVHMTALNVPRAMASDLKDIAQTVLGSPQKISTTTDPKSDAMMMTLLREPYHMVEIASIMEPMVDQWSKLASTKSFWLWRRARPLPEWVPLSPTARKDLVRGWFMARLQGIAYEASDGQLRVDVDGEDVALANAGVRRSSHTSHPGRVVEGVAIAALEAFRTRSLDPFVPYRTLIRLGASYDEKGNQLQSWILDDRGTTAAREYEDFEVDLTTAQGRREGALALTDAWLSSYAEDPKRFSNTSQAQRDAAYELNADILETLEQIKSSLTRRADGRIYR